MTNGQACQRFYTERDLKLMGGGESGDVLDSEE